MTRTIWIAAALSALLTACATDEFPAPQPRRVERDWLSEIRSEAAKVSSAVDVVPLADPAVDDLRRRAFAAIEAGQYQLAEGDLQLAISIRDTDPSLHQSLAEVAIAQRQWAAAESAAQQSYDLGPKIGALCVRNWLTVFATRIERGDAVGAASARAQVQNCRVSAPTRF